jgi:hypothetical protein
MSRLIRPLWMALAVTVGVIAHAWAQSGTAGLQGKVVDEQKSAVPGATVTLSDATTGYSRPTVTTENGTFGFTSVPPGTYKLTVELTGFRTAVLEKVQLQVDSTSTTEVTLQIGNISEAVQVVAETPTINTADASMGNVITGNQIRELPLEARNVAGLLSLQAGVTFVPGNNSNTMDARAGVVDPRYGAVSGTRADQSNVTLDGIDVNDAQNQAAFTSVLRVTLDSVQEFRVSTSNYSADQGRSSGAQVSLVTRSGTNRYSGAGYWVNRDTRFSANEYFLKLSQLEADQESKAPLLNKNIYGFALGGPLRKDKFFFFGNFEGLNEKREEPVVREVPSASFRDGVLIYQCAVASACPGGTVRGLSNSHSVPAGSYGMTPAEIARVDPQHIGVNTAALEYFRQYPLPTESGNYPGNIDTLRFAAPLDNKFKTYLARLDFKPGGSQNVFGRLNFQDDSIQNVPQFAGKAPNSVEARKNWGFAVGHDVALGPSRFNSLRYGYTVIDADRVGLKTGPAATFRFIDSLDALTASFGRKLGTSNIIDDFSWIKGEHTLKFGANIRWTRNDTFDNTNSFPFFQSNPSWVPSSGARYMPGGACPAPADCSGLPAVSPSARSNYSDPFIHMLGILSDNDAIYNYTIDGGLLSVGDPVRRRWASDEYELYAHDSWRLTDNLTVTAGVRYSLFSPPYEANGVQVAPSPNLGEWFNTRQENMLRGIPSNASELITFDKAGPKNNATGFYGWDKNNVAPRLSAAWTPGPKTVVRGGYSIVYDRIGSGIATSFDAGGSFGLSTDLNTPFGTVNERSDPSVRFRGVNYTPEFLLDPAPEGGFPQTPPTGAGVITSSIDSSIKTPYSHVFNFVVGRELGKGFGVEAAYVGRRGRNQLVRRDLAMPLNLVDARSGVDYFTAVRQLLAASANGVEGMAPIPYWENLFPDAAFDGFSATQNMAQSFQDNNPDFITALWDADQNCFPACSVFGPFAYFAEQYDALASRSTIGKSEYDALQLTLRKRYGSGFQFDFNYTFARAKDHTSEVERGANFANFGSGGYSGFLINTWEPDLNYSYSDYDVRHQFNLNYLVELPFGHGKKVGNGMGRLANAIVGDWAMAGIVRWTSGFPFNVINCRQCWATNWNLQGNAELADPGQLPVTEQTKNAVDGRPSPFADPQAAIEAFRFQLPGETGIRNLLRGDGYFAIDTSVSKSFSLPRGNTLRFRWDVFNLTNTPRFDTGDLEVLPDRAASFGRYNASLASCDGAAGRCMQLNLRYEF